MMKISVLLCLIFLCITFSCKENLLDEKPDKKLVVPATLNDLQGLLDKSSTFQGDYRICIALSAGDYYMTAEDWNGLGTEVETSCYVWNSNDFKNIIEIPAWNNSYEQVFYANVVLEGLKKISPGTSQQVAWNNIKGTALFFRSYAFYNVASIFAKFYNPLEASDEPGIPLRLESDPNLPTLRASLEDTYKQILGDLKEAAALLPDIQPSKTRPTSAAAFGLLARIYLSIEEYRQAFVYSDSCLKLHSELMDYNDLDTTANFPIPDMNEEVLIRRSLLPNYRALRGPTGKIDTVLYGLYSNDDLRRSIFFHKNDDGSASFKGGYNGSRTLFSGVATDEVYLIRAECYARQGKTGESMADLNALLKNRWRTGTFVPLTAETSEEALRIILEERRKELLFRGLRWSDLRRLNKDSRFQQTLKRVLGGQEYILLPNDPRYVFPIPEYIIRATGIEQNKQ